MPRPVRLLLAFAAVAAALLVPLPGLETVAGSFWSLLPPLLAVSLALLFRDVLLSLFLGVWLGAAMIADGNLWAGFLRVVDTHARSALVDSDHISILMFSMLLGGMVGVMSRCGGTHGVVRALEPLATTARRSQAITWLMGMLIFFDDYSNTLIVGNAMRPVTDSHRISREKLAYLVDSTAAPVATVALVSTWIGYQVSLLGDALADGGSTLNPFAVFFLSIPYAFYPLIALVVTLTAAVSGRDWGPMLRAEQRARTGEVMASSARPLADYESTGLAPDDDVPRRWFNAAIPVVTVVAVTVVGLWVSGRAELLARGERELGLREIVGASDPFTVLLWASLLGLVVALGLAVGQRLLEVREALDATLQGFKSMFMAVVVLTLAWSLGGVCEQLDTAGYLVGAVGENLPAAWIPAVVFLVAAGVSFATGTSWGTMAILTPLAVPLVLAAAPEASLTHVLAATVSAILGGSVFGDHCSPISDTTIMSSMASGCDHIDHVRTQLPYALFGAGLALVVGYAPVAAFDAPPWLMLPIAWALVVLWFRLVARPAD